MADDVRLITLAPAHFHAALVQKQRLPGVARRSSIYARLGSDLREHLKRIEGFNARAEHPTDWELDIHCSDDPLRRLCAGRPGNVVVIAGRCGGKMEAIRACLDAGLNVLADKPWILQAAQIAALEEALELADRRGLVAYDIMTERFEPTNILQRSLVSDPEVFGVIRAVNQKQPGVEIESVHHLLKFAAGVPNLRPAFFFDPAQQGTAIADVGTHLVDLVAWTLFPEQPIGRQDLRVGATRRWPTMLTAAQFQRVTGLVNAGPLEFDGNGEIRYQARGVQVRLTARWN